MSRAKKDKRTKREHFLPLFGIPRLFPYLKPYRKKIIFMAFLAMLSSVIDTIYPLFNRYALDHFVALKTLEGVGFFIALYIGVLLFQAAIVYRSMLDSGIVEMSVDRDLRNAAFAHIQLLSFSYFNQNSVGYIHARVMSDTGKIGEAISWRMMDFIWDGAYLLFAVVVMLSIHPRLAAWMLVLMGITSLLIVWFQRILVKQNREVRNLNAVISGDYNEGVTGAGTIKILGIEEKMIRRFRGDARNMYRKSVLAGKTSAFLVSAVALMSSVALSLVLWQGQILSAAGLMKIGTLSVFMSYAMGMMEPLQRIIDTISAFILIQVNIERFTKLLEETPDVADTAEVIEKYGDSFHPKYENWEELHGDVEFRDVTFRYPDGEEYVLEHFNLKIPKGSSIAIVGETGAGKTTLVNLICRFYEPTMGQVLIDGRDVRERSLLWLHSHLGYVLQSPHLFSGSIRDNLCYGKTDATDEEILEALRLVHADGIVGKMGGLDAQVGEGGNQLSTGEKQLFSFARALLADPKLLVLDEATSSVDTVTEHALQQAIRTVTSGRTSFMIAHRLSTIREADQILVVEDGKIVEHGTHGELMSKHGLYFDLYMRQQIYEETL